MLKTKRLELVGFDKAYASDLYELWSDLLEQFPNAAIHADAVEENRASRNVLKKLGFRECGIDAGAFRDHGFVCNLVNYEYNE